LAASENDKKYGAKKYFLEILVIFRHFHAFFRRFFPDWINNSPSLVIFIGKFLTKFLFSSKNLKNILSYAKK